MTTTKRWFGRLAVLAGVALVASTAGAQAVISNGTIQLGVNEAGALNVSSGDPFYGGVGVHYIPNGWDGTYAGCTCEGWGAGISGGAHDGIWGGQNTASGGTFNLSSITPLATDLGLTEATSVVTIADGATDVLRITQAYKPNAKTLNLYEVTVTLENLTGSTLGSGAHGIRYRRAMDWDIPTPGEEQVSLTGWGATDLIGTSSNGFIDPNPFHNPGAICSAPQNANFSNIGPCDHGAVFDFGFGELAGGATKTFTIFYGAGANLGEVKTALGLVGAEVASWAFCARGESDFVNGGACQGDAGTTFVFGFQGVGGIPISSTPEPSTYVLMATGLAGVFGFARRRRNNA